MRPLLLTALQHPGSPRAPTPRGPDLACVRSASPSLPVFSAAIGGLLLALLASPAAAEDASWWNATTPESEPGFYLGLSGSVAILYGFDDEIEVTDFRDQQDRNLEVEPKDTAGIGLHARAGYRFHPRMAVEAHVEWIREWSIQGKDGTRPTPSSTSTVASGDAWAATADFKFYLGTAQFQPHLVGGIGALRFSGENESPRITNNNRRIFEFNTDEVSATGFAFRGGGGVDWMMTDRLALVLATTYVVGFGDVAEFDFLSVEWGVQYRF